MTCVIAPGLIDQSSISHLTLVILSHHLAEATIPGIKDALQEQIAGRDAVNKIIAEAFSEAKATNMIGTDSDTTRSNEASSPDPWLRGSEPVASLKYRADEHMLKSKAEKEKSSQH